MTFRNVLLPALALCTAYSARPAYAHFIWAEIAEGTPAVAKIAFSDAPGLVSEEGTVDRIKTARVRDAHGKDVLMKQDGDVRSGLLGKSRVFGLEQYYGVLDKTNEKRGVFKLLYYAKSAASLDDANHDMKLPFEFFARREGAKEVVVTLKRGAVPYEKAGVNLFEPGEKKWRVLTTDAKGEIRFEATKPGLYGMKGAWVDQTPGEIDGKKYPFIRNYTTLTFRVPGSAAAPAAPILVTPETQ